MPPEVMRTDLHPHQHAGLSHNDPRGGIGDRKDPFIGPDLSLDDVRLEKLSDLQRKKDTFGFLAAFGVGQGNLPVLDIFASQAQDLTNAHTAPCHEFQYEAVPGVLRPEDYLIDDILIENGPLLGLRVSEDLPEHGRVAGIGETGIEDVLAEVEEGRQERVSELLGPLAYSIRLLGEEAPDLVGGQGIHLAMAELGFKFGKEEMIIPEGVFFGSSLSDTRRSAQRPSIRP